MIIDLRDIQAEQVEFINYLEKDPKKINGKNKFGVTKEQAICLLSELMEVCNAGKIHKWWDLSVRNRDDIAEELSDLMAHLCNIANYTGISLIYSNENEITQNDCIESLIMSLAGDIVQIPYSRNKTFVRHKISNILCTYIQLIYTLGFNIDEIKEAYDKKLRINYTRF